MDVVHREKKAILASVIEARKKGVLILGAGITGQEVARAFLKANSHVTLLDESPNPKLSSDLKENEQLELISGYSVDKDNTFFSTCSAALIVSSPGIRQDGAFYKAALNTGIPVFSELDIGIAFCGMPKVAVTGTNGKTTVTTLVHEMLLRSGLKSKAVGNLGSPLIGFSDLKNTPIDNESELFVCEVSSYQLTHLQHFAPQVSVLMNIADDHLGWHNGFKNYVEAKKKIFLEQEKSAWSLIWKEDPLFEELSAVLPSQVLPFGIANSNHTSELGSWVTSDNKTLYLNLKSHSMKFDLQDTRFIGSHNMINLAAATAASILAGASEEGVKNAIDMVVPLPHRLELIVEKSGVKYINDSKATNVAAVCAALSSIAQEEKNVILLLGGLSKEGSWLPLLPLIKENCRKVIAFGADREKIINSLEGVQIRNCYDLKAAFFAAVDLARPGDIVLMSPGCASFDAYPNYGARGEHYRTLCQSL